MAYQTIGRVAGDGEGDDCPADAMNFFRVRRHRHAFFGRGGAGGGKAAQALNAYNAETASAERFQMGAVTQCRDEYACLVNGIENRRSFRNKGFLFVYRKLDAFHGQTSVFVVALDAFRVSKNCDGLVFAGFVTNATAGAFALIDKLWFLFFPADGAR